MRTLGVGILGLFGGLLIGFGVQEVLARIAVAAGGGQLPDSLVLGIVLGYLIPVFAAAGVVSGIAIDRRIRRRTDNNSGRVLR